MERIEDYILRPQTERQAHLRLDEDCDERGGFSSYYKGLLAYYLDTSIPAGRKVHVCHACHNAACSNVHHLYWGTPSENNKDAITNGRPASPYYALLAKHGHEGTHQILSEAAKGNTSARALKGSTKSEETKAKISASLLNRKGSSNAGRKPAMDTELLLGMVQTNGFEQTAKDLGINIDAVRARYYRVKKKQ